MRGGRREAERRGEKQGQSGSSGKRPSARARSDRGERATEEGAHKGQAARRTARTAQTGQTRKARAKTPRAHATPTPPQRHHRHRHRHPHCTCRDLMSMFLIEAVLCMMGMVNKQIKRNDFKASGRKGGSRTPSGATWSQRYGCVELHAAVRSYSSGNVDYDHVTESGGEVPKAVAALPVDTQKVPCCRVPQGRELQGREMIKEVVDFKVSDQKLIKELVGFNDCKALCSNRRLPSGATRPSRPSNIQHLLNPGTPEPRWAADDPGQHNGCAAKWQAGAASGGTRPVTTRGQGNKLWKILRIDKKKKFKTQGRPATVKPHQRPGGGA